MQNNIFPGDFADQNIIIVEETTSTNDLLKAQASNFTPRDNFTAIMAKHQTNGRGQRDNSFHSDAEKSLTFSFILFPKQLSIADVFIIQTWISLGVYDWFRQYTDDVKIKWPNDIMLRDKKACGTLIENTLQGKTVKNSIVGIGLNILQEQFPENIAQRATSLKIHQPNLPEKGMLEYCRELMVFIRRRYEMQWHSPEELLADYNDKLYKKNEDISFRTGTECFRGKILHADRDGILHIDDGKTIQTFRFKEVSIEENL